MRIRGHLTRAAALSMCLVLGVTLAAQAAPHQSDKLHIESLLYSQIVPLDPADMEGVGPGQQGRHEDNCGPFGEAGRGAFDKDISCDDPVAPDNENAIAVHPTNPDLVLGGSNDYQINFVGNTSILHVPSGFFLSQDGGGTWIDGELPLKGSLGGGDPVPAWNLKYELAVFTSLSFVCGQFAPLCSRGNIHFASFDYTRLTGSADDEITWSDQTIANGNSSDAAAQQIFLDKEWIAVDNNPNSPHFGNMYVTFSAFRSENGAYDESPIMFVKSEDGGRRWTLPVEITGRNPAYCTFQDDPDDTADTNGPNSDQATAEGPDDPFACDQDQFSIPVVAPNGDLYVHFQNEQNSAAYELPQRYDSQIMIVKSTDGGDTFFGETPTAENQNDNPATPTNEACVAQEQAAAGAPVAGFPNPCIVPIHVVNLEDSYDNFSQSDDGNGTAFPDYPQNVIGRNTLTGHQFRVNSAGNIAVGPTPGGAPSPYRVWITWADNFAGVRPGPGVSTVTNPTFVPITNTEVYYAFSDDGGQTWVGGDEGGTNGPRLTTHVPEPAGDQWFPWSDTDTLGNLHVGFMDGSAHGGPRQTYGFSLTMVPLAGTPANPRVVVSSAPSTPNNALFFRAQTPDCSNCATFIGDYNGLDVDSDNRVHAIWTDMRRAAPAPFPTRAVEDAFYARNPPPTP